jgi:ribonuclease HII
MAFTKIVIGVDEAGYGPSMGPLTICATAWRVPETLDVSQLTQRLEPEFLAKPIQRGTNHIPIGDSKKINREAFGKVGLNLGASFLCYELDGTQVSDWDRCLAALAEIDWHRLLEIPWYAACESKYDQDLKSFGMDLTAFFQNGRKKLGLLGMQLVDLQMRVLDEPEFNKQVDLAGNKSNVLSETSLKLVREVISKVAQSGESIEVFCDKHGGRNRYQGVLSFCFDDEWFSADVEGRTCSRYTATWREHPLSIQFQVDGDTIFPSAAASVMAKWTRESLMERLNAFWCSKVAGSLAPTAGYYVDAVRFAGQIEATSASMNIGREQWWRKK